MLADTEGKFTKVIVFNNQFFKILSYKQAVDLELDAVAALGNIRSKR